MTEALFHWVVLLRDVPGTEVRSGDRAVIVDLLAAPSEGREAGYSIEVFRDGETVDVVSVPVSWVTVGAEVWGKVEAIAL
jgi:Domain of unknown function (DUF4926)